MNCSGRGLGSSCLCPLYEFKTEKGYAMKKLFNFILILAMILESFSVCYAENDYAMADYSSVSPVLSNINTAVNGVDGLLEAVERDGVAGVKIFTKPNDNLTQNNRINFNINNRWAYALSNGEGIAITVSYFDEGAGSFVIEYDARTNARKTTEVVYITGTDTWKTHTFNIYDAYFGNRLNNNDFSLCLFNEQAMEFSKSDVIFNYIKIEKTGKSFPIDVSENISKIGNIYKRGEIPTISLNAENITDLSFSANYKLTVKNSYGELVKEKESRVKFDVGESTINIGTEIVECGAYEAEIEFSNNAGFYGVFKTNFSISVDAEINDYYGTNTHYRITERDPQKSLPIATAGGAGYIRDEILWKEYETEQGVYTMPEKYSNYIDTALENNLEVLVVLGYTNEFYDGGLIPKSADGLKAFGNYVYDVVSKLKGKVDTFEVWNEFHHNQENLTAQDYVNILEVAYKRAKEANPECTIVGLGGMPGTWAYWIGNSLVCGADKYMDVLSLHEYDDYFGPEKKMLGWINNVKAYMTNYNCTKPIWITETGWSTGDVTGYNVGRPRWSDEEQYSFGIRQYVMYKNIGIDKYFWYDLKNDGSNRREQQNFFGTIYKEDDSNKVPYSARPSYVAFANMNDKLANADVTEYTENADGTQVYKFTKPDGENVWVLWNVTQDVTAEIAIDDDNLDVVDVFGNNTKLEKESGVYKIDVSSEPVYICTAEEQIEEPETELPYGINITEINYKTGAITVVVNGFALNELTAVQVLKPGKVPADVYTEKLGALAYLWQPDGKTKHEFTFKAEDEGTYSIYANMGSELIKLGVAFYKPFGATLSIKQEDKTVTTFGEITENKPITVIAEIDNSNGSGSTYLLMLGIYKDGKLTGVSAVNGRLNSELLTEEITAELQIGTLDKFDTVKSFLWKDNTRLIPVTDVMELSSK